MHCSMCSSKLVQPILWHEFSNSNLLQTGGFLLNEAMRIKQRTANTMWKSMGLNIVSLSELKLGICQVDFTVLSSFVSL